MLKKIRSFRIMKHVPHLRSFQFISLVFIISLFQSVLMFEMKNIYAASLRAGHVNYVPNPEFISPVKNQTAAVGREAIFSCSVSNLGKFKVGWLRASDKMIIAMDGRTVIHNERIQVKYEPEIKFKSLSNAVLMNEESQELVNPINGTWKLIIRHLKETDRGCYMCQINTNPMISQSGCLDILVSPDILSNETSADLSVIEGENATLTCKATGKPEPKITWKREDGNPILLRHASSSSFYNVSVYNGSVLNLRQVDRKQMGTYLCIAKNNVHPSVSKRVTLSVNFLPNVQAVNQLLGAPEGTDVILECNVEAHPNSVNYWFKNPNKMLLDGVKYMIYEKRDGYKVSMHLTIKNFNVEDKASYSCISSNSLGKVEAISRLYIITDTDDRSIFHDSYHISRTAGLAEGSQRSSSIKLANYNFFDFWKFCIFVELYSQRFHDIH